MSCKDTNLFIGGNLYLDEFSHAYYLREFFFLKIFQWHLALLLFVEIFICSAQSILFTFLDFGAMF